MPELIRVACQLLAEMFDEKKVLFSYSSFLSSNNLVNNFAHPSVIRYTINVLVGLQRANSFNPVGWDFEELLDKFLSSHYKEITNEADNGLLLYLLSVSGHELQNAQFRKLEQIANNRERLLSLNLQDICWMLLGLTKYADLNKDRDSSASAEKLFKNLNKYFLNKNTFLPYHILKKRRKQFVSFGAIVFFLWALYEYSRVFNDKHAESIFLESCLRIIKLQGEQGEWPWFINSNDLKIMDWYQIYSVHQDSMAMLFLFPALDLGVIEAKNSIIKSYQWLFGDNELGEKMINDHPFFIYRSIRKKGRCEKEKRFMRSVLLSMRIREAKKVNLDSLEINRECRSYHLGWLLYVWSGIHNHDELTELKGLSL